MNASEHLKRFEDFKHLERSDGIHVGSHYGDARPFHFGISENILAIQIDFRTRPKRTAFRAKQDVFKIKLHIFFNSHILLLKENYRGCENGGCS